MKEQFDGKRRAKEILGEYGRDVLPISPPIDVIGIANYHGIKVYKANFTGIYEKALYGFIRRSGDDVEIYVNAADAYYRQRFTIAHELGHYFCHEYINDIENLEYVDLRSDASSPEEVQANKFASELLMPDDLVKNEYGKLLFPTISELSRIFHASKPAMTIKLRQLGLDAGDI